MMHRRSIIGIFLGVCVGLNTKLRSAAAWALISEDQSDEINNPKPAAAPSTITVPVIEIIEPDMTMPIRSPVKIRIRFQAPAGASIKPESFRATYGWFDISDQLISHAAKIDALGISADDAEIPKGKYKITLHISDTKGRIGTQELNFQVV
jgi:hypothetical protein